MPCFLEKGADRSRAFSFYVAFRPVRYAVQMRFSGVAAFLLLALMAGISLGAVAKFGLGSEIETQFSGDPQYTPE